MYDKIFGISLLLALIYTPLCTLHSEFYSAGRRAAEIKQETEMEQNILAIANNKFGLSLFKEARKDMKGKNTFMSPLSISSVLAMTQIGARNKTAQEMAQVLEWGPEKGDKIHQLFQTYFTTLQKPAEQYQLSTVNRIFLEQTFAILDEFKSKTKTWYLAEPVQANFIENADNEAKNINSWVAEQTQDKIKDLFAPGVLNSASRMVLVNAIYFKGKWDKEFEKSSTLPKPFKLSPDQKIDVPTMNHKQVHGLYQDRDLNVTAVELLYKGHDLSMIIILPNEDYGLEELVNNLTPEKLDALLKGVTSKKREIQLFLPKFEVTSSFTLKQALTTLGMVDAFSFAAADFTGMTGQPDLVLSEVVHKAFVHVNEEGTEAAAATGAVMMMRSLPAPPPVVNVDHPFLFVIIDKRVDGSILFLGQVDNPKA
uniref:Serpin domain-containing protein n=3 Tax=Arion vulgaris TaxID=1028688 RepID=A0A0B7BU60_9EUPU